MLCPSPQRCRMRPEGGGRSSWDCLPHTHPAQGHGPLFLRHPQTHLVIGTTGVMRHTDSRLQPHRLSSLGLGWGPGICIFAALCWVPQAGRFAGCDQFHLPVDSDRKVVQSWGQPRVLEEARFGGPGLSGSPPAKERKVSPRRDVARGSQSRWGPGTHTDDHSRPLSGE